jgi:hypothetical protein
MLRILHLGAGVQSTALYLMSLRRDEPEFVPYYDYAIFADTQEEPFEVYVHLEWLQGLGGPPILQATAGKLGDNLINGINGINATGQRFASIPAFTSDTEGVPGGLTRRQCTKEYKVDVVERVIRREIMGLKPGQRMPKGTLIEQHMGLSFDEGGRIFRVKGRFESIPWSEPAFPLWDMEMTRRGCNEYLKRVAPEHPVARSACVFCPYKSNAEWRRLRDTDPDGWARAVAVDEGMRKADAACRKGLDQRLYIHRSCLPLAVAPIDTPESRGEQSMFGFANECEGMCGL